MTEATAPPQSAPKLHCLGQSPVPEPILACWQTFEALSEKARIQIWDVLAPLIVQGLNEEVGKISTNYCQTHKVSPQDLERSVEACHFLLAQAARLDLDEAHFREDLEAVSSEGQPGVQSLMTHFVEMSAFLRKRIIEGSLLDHGKVFSGLDWRIDLMGASDRGLHLDLPMALVTLRYQEGYGEHNTKGKMSLYLTPEAVHELKQTCERLEVMLESGKKTPRE
jgi:hypothetical protein